MQQLPLLTENPVEGVIRECLVKIPIESESACVRFLLSEGMLDCFWDIDQYQEEPVCANSLFDIFTQFWHFNVYHTKTFILGETAKYGLRPIAMHCAGIYLQDPTLQIQERLVFVGDKVKVMDDPRLEIIAFSDVVWYLKK